ncbi:Tn7 transposase TnsA N-terminal domain-containing protein [Thalassotalea ganghwensis]
MNKNVYKFASSKVGSVIMCESSIEFDACFHHEYNDNVEYFESQPMGFHYQVNNKWNPYTPDALVRYKSGKCKLIEYKPYSKTQDLEFQHEFNAKKANAATLGYELILVTEQQIRVNPILHNLKLLHRYSGSTRITDIQSSILEFIQKSGKIAISDIDTNFSLTTGEIKASIYLLLAKGIVKADIKNECLESNPMVWC